MDRGMMAHGLLVGEAVFMFFGYFAVFQGTSAVFELGLLVLMGGWFGRAFEGAIGSGHECDLLVE